MIPSETIPKPAPPRSENPTMHDLSSRPARVRVEAGRWRHALDGSRTAAGVKLRTGSRHVFIPNDDIMRVVGELLDYAEDLEVEL